MNVLTPSELRMLAAQTGWPRVSLYLPTITSPPDAHENPVRLKNLLRTAEMQLLADKMEEATVKNLLKPAVKLAEDLSFWSQRKRGCAIFLAPDVFLMYPVNYPFDEMVKVADRFFMKPLVAAMESNQPFYLLTLSQKQVHLFRGDRDELIEVEVKGMPASLEEALHLDRGQPAMQTHSAHGAVRGQMGKQAAVFHGQGGLPDDRKEEVTEFCRAVDKVVSDYLKDETNPLMLAGVEYVQTLYRKITHLPNLMDEGISGNVEYLNVTELHKQAWSLVEQHMEKRRQEKLRQLAEMNGGSKSSHDLPTILKAAMEGRIETLFLDPRQTEWGTIDPETFATTSHEEPLPGDQDLLETATAQTLLHRGSIVIEEETPFAAVFRY